MASKLKPCPFCGFSGVEVLHDNGWQYVYCGECHARGPNGIYKQHDVKKLWNTRPKQRRGRK